MIAVHDPSPAAVRVVESSRSPSPPMFATPPPSRPTPSPIAESTPAAQLTQKRKADIMPWLPRMPAKKRFKPNRKANVPRIDFSCIPENRLSRPPLESELRMGTLMLHGRDDYPTKIHHMEFRVCWLVKTS